MAGLMFDVVVIGGGHAGCEAAAAAARMGARTALLTHRLDTVGVMSCNPAIGGIGKGHLVREVDALDGLMARAADLAGIHFKVLNRRKGPAVQGPRAQADRELYRRAVQGFLREQPGLELIEGAAEALVVGRNRRISGVRLADKRVLGCAALVLCAGTFLRGMIHVGGQRAPAGRVNEAPAVGLAVALGGLELPVGRLKTGTPPRLRRASVDWDGLQADRGDEPPVPFSTMTRAIGNPQMECRVTATNERTHAIVRAHLHDSAVYGGHVAGRGPRYCPSLEDKVVRFAERASHQIFLEPEGLGSDLVYPNGISISLPEAVQRDVVRTIDGLQRAEIAVPGYAVEYDYVDPRALTPALEVRAMPGLFLAGQVNGTTGYEEAAGQGILAGINAARLAGGSEPAGVSRADAYIGVMVDDLVTKGVTEPYRMFTSRSEFRLSLRSDNADQRLTELGIAWGCVGPARAAEFRVFRDRLVEARQRAEQEGGSPTALARQGVSVRRDGRWRSVFDLLGAGGVQDQVVSAFPWLLALPARVRAQLLTDAAYHAYLERQEADLRLFRRDESLSLAGIDWTALPGLSAELRARLSAHGPDSVGAASRLEGMTPAALALLTAFALRSGARPAARGT